jgi:Ca-activated chloride channel family protein
MGLNHLPFHFLHPAWLLALPALLLFTVWLARGTRSDSNWSRVVDAHLLRLLRVDEGRTGGRSPWFLLAGVWTLAVLALAGPAWTRTQSPAFRAPAAWVLVLDLSPSMSASDVTPTRVARARYAAMDLLSAAHDARVGLVAFAGEPHTVAPLTTDISTIRLLLQPLDPSLMPEAGDRLAPALEEAQRLLQAGLAKHGQIVVFSDGAADPVESLRVAQRLRGEGTSVNIVGVGTQNGAPEPNGKGDFVHDPSGRVHLTRLQTDELQRVAAAGGGEYVPVSGVSSLVARLQSAQSQEVDTSSAAARERLTTWQNGGIWLLPPLLLLAALLARRGWI